MTLEIHDFKSIIACFWKNAEGNWEGVVPNNINNQKEVKIIQSKNVILLLPLEDFCELDQSSR